MEKPRASSSTMSPSIPAAENYHKWIFSLIKPWLRGNVLEVGFGYGQYTADIAGFAGHLAAVDLDPECCSLPVPDNVTLMVADLERDSFTRVAEPGSIDCAVCVNVLEHIRDDRAALTRLRDMLRPGGYLFVFVPAFAELYGDMDRLAGHYRRYTVNFLSSVIRDAGFGVIRTRYFNPIGGLGWWYKSKFTRVESLADLQVNRQILFFDRYLLPISRLINPFTEYFFGQSVWCVAKRSD